ncbi:MAG TPA: c-type cytochrome [Rhizomicrobium sp.]|jgi:cytochrome c|nr:c-type cytochrome [Rhizomicrobium sp.]
MRTLVFAGVLLALASPASAASPGDPARGAAIYQDYCGACHSLDANRVGPRHRGVFGRKAGSIGDFHYTAALKASGIVWNAQTLDRWLTDPQKLVPGTAMGFRLGDPVKRADVIAYLKLQK